MDLHRQRRRNSRQTRLIWLASFVLCCMLSVQSQAQAPTADSAANDLQVLEEALQHSQQSISALESQSAQAETALADLRRRLVGLAGSVRERESNLQRLEDETRAVEMQEARMLAALGRERETLGQLLAALQRLHRYPPELIVARGDDPLEAIRGALLLGATLPGLEQQARALRQQLDGLRALRQQLDQRRTATARARGELGASREELEALIAERETLLASTRIARAVEASHAARLGLRAENLRDLLAKLEAERAAREAAEAARRAAQQAAEREAAAKAERDRQAREALAMLNAPDGRKLGLGRGLAAPVAGTVFRRFGQRDDVGARARGISLNVAAGASILSPAAGKVAFAGPFRDFGQILILEHRAGYHSLLVGFGRVDAEVGQQVAAGEPVGLMPGPDVATRPVLYYELRRNGEPIDPAKGLGG